MVRIGQELLLIRHDLRERVRDRRSVLVREIGSDELIEQRDHMIETRRRYTRRSGRGIRYDNARRC